jgi:hypothetical protein
MGRPMPKSAREPKPPLVIQLPHGAETVIDADDAGLIVYVGYHKWRCVQMNNRRSNIRLCTHAQNQQNRDFQGSKGVRPTRSGKWQARLRGRAVGTFPTREEAEAAYDAAARSQYGEFARTNA